MLSNFALGVIVLLASSSALVRAVERDDEIVGYSEMDRTFIVIGATGAGKSTFINSLVHKATTTMPRNSGASPSSQTKEVQQHVTPRYRMNLPIPGKKVQECSVYNPSTCVLGSAPTHTETGVKVTFFDTIGVDADDVNSKQVFATLVKAVASEKVHGFLLVHKMERFRKSFHEELKAYLRMLKELGISTNKILLVITHGGQYSDEVKEMYTKELCQLLTWFPDCAQRTMHANFVNLNEIHPEFRDFYVKQWPVVFRSVMEKLAEYTEPFYPLANIVEKAGGFDVVMSKIEDRGTYYGAMTAGVRDTFRAVGGGLWGKAKEDVILG